MGKLANRKGASILTAPDEMTIYTAAEMKPVLIDHLTNGSDLELDLSKVKEIDSAGLQLLILMKTEAQRQEKRITFTGHNKLVQEVIEIFNLSNYFGDPMLLQAADKKASKTK